MTTLNSPYKWNYIFHCFKYKIKRLSHIVLILSFDGYSDYFNIIDILDIENVSGIN